ncbi:MAG: FecR domain-containing protein [Pseudomonadota bacterium]|nr:FecR domain-containing protein [Pseudomonadota bacterium]
MSPTWQLRGTVIQQAIEWHQRLDQGEMDADSQREFRAWMRSPGHAKELARICLIDALLQRDPLLKRRSPPPLPENVIHFQSYAPPRARVPRPPDAATANRVVKSSVSERFKKQLAIAACGLIAALVFVFGGRTTNDQPIVTEEGRWDRQLLADGTVVNAGPRTRLRFDFDAGERRVTLEQGEALFDVAKDPARPFIVTTDAGTVQAIGTAFATADIGDEVIVTVASGKVAVTSAAGVQPMLPVGANQQTVLSRSGASEPVTVNAEREVKWIRNWYEYDGEQVGEIIAQLNRRHGVKVIVDDPQVTRLRMNSLSFKPSEPEQFVAKINEWYADYPGKAGSPIRQRGGGIVLHLQRP